MSSLLKDLPALAALTRGDIFFVTKDPDGAPADNKINIEILFGNLPKLDSIVFQSEVDSATFFLIKDASGAILFTFDSVNGHFGVNTGVPAAPIDAQGDGLTPLRLTRSAASANNQPTRLSFNQKDSAEVVRETADIKAAWSDNTAGSVDSYMSFQTRNGGGASTERVRIDNVGNELIGTTASPTVSGGKVLVFGDNAADPTMAANTAGFYGKDVAATVEAFAADEAGNAAQLTSHPQDAPAAFYLPGDELPPYIQKSFNVYIAKIEWFRPSTTLQAYETFAAYNTRRGLTAGGTEFMVRRDWTEQQQIQVDSSEAEHAAWEVARDAAAVAEEPFVKPEPVIYTAQKPPQSLQDRGITLNVRS